MSDTAALLHQTPCFFLMSPLPMLIEMVETAPRHASARPLRRAAAERVSG